jgi:hypothetical protein
MEQWIVAPGIRPLIDRVLPLALGPLSEGIAYVRSHRAVGKVGLRVDQDRSEIARTADHAGEIDRP